MESKVKFINELFFLKVDYALDLWAILKCCIGNGFIISCSYFSEYDMKENDGEFDEIILDSFGNLRGQMF